MRRFSTSALCFGRTAVSIVPPVHHTVKFRKFDLMDKFAGLRTARSSVESSKFRPQVTTHDRVQRHYYDTIQSDMLLINYDHDAERVYGDKPRERPKTNPYRVYQPYRLAFGNVQATKDIKVRDWRNVPFVEAVTLNCFVKKATQNHDLAIAAKLQLQQITGEKPSGLFSRSNVPAWTLRPGMPMGAKIKITGQPMRQFLSTLTELVLPRSKTFEGISNRSGDSNGNITFTLSSDDIRYFPEIEGNLELWPQTFEMNVFLHTSAQTDREARTLLSAFGFPFKGEEKIKRW